jgi:hypothetical protein
VNICLKLKRETALACFIKAKDTGFLSIILQRVHLFIYSFLPDFTNLITTITLSDLVTSTPEQDFRPILLGLKKMRIVTFSIHVTFSEQDFCPILLGLKKLRIVTFSIHEKSSTAEKTKSQKHLKSMQVRSL